MKVHKLITEYMYAFVRTFIHIRTKVMGLCAAIEREIELIEMEILTN